MIDLSKKPKKQIELNLEAVHTKNRMSQQFESNNNILLPGQVPSPRQENPGSNRNQNNEFKNDIQEYEQYYHSRFESVGTDRPMIENKETNFNPKKLNEDLILWSNNSFDNDNRNEHFQNVSCLQDSQYDDYQPKNNHTNDHKMIELSQYSFQTEKMRSTPLFDKIDKMTAESTNQKFGSNQTFSGEQTSSLFKSISFQRDLLQKGKPKQNKRRLACLDGLFLRYFIFKSVSLKWCLYVIMCIDMVFVLLDISNLQFHSGGNSFQDILMIASDSSQIFLFIPMFICQIFLIRTYRTVFAKSIYGIKLTAFVIFIATKATSFITLECNYDNIESRSIKQEQIYQLECKRINQIIGIIGTSLFQIISCWVLLSIIYWIRRDRVDIIQGMKRLPLQSNPKKKKVYKVNK